MRCNGCSAVSAQTATPERGAAALPDLTSAQRHVTHREPTAGRTHDKDNGFAHALSAQNPAWRSAFPPPLRFHPLRGSARRARAATYRTARRLRLCHNSRESEAATRKSRLRRRPHRACAEARGPAPASGQVALGGGEGDGERRSGRAVGDGRGSGGPREAARRGPAGSSRCGAPRGAAEGGGRVGPCPEAARLVGTRGLWGEARSRRSRAWGGVGAVVLCRLPRGGRW